MGELKLENNPYTFAEYLAIDAESENRYEYDNGIVWDMAGTSTAHNIIVGNLAFIFRLALKNQQRNCRIFSENIRLEVIPEKVYYYPDLIFTCDKEDMEASLTLKNPSLVIEVISESSFFMDLSLKMEKYMQMESLKYYLAIDQKECRVRCLEKINDKWIYSIYREMNEIILLPQIEMQLKVSEIYENIAL